MNILVAKMLSLFKSDRYAENTIDLAEKPISTAAVVEAASFTGTMLARMTKDDL